MNTQPSFSRRQFATTIAAGAASLAIPATAEEVKLAGKIKKTLKGGMIKDGKNLEEKLLIAKEAGFEGVEFNLPST